MSHSQAYPWILHNETGKSVGYRFVHVQSYSQESSESPCFSFTSLTGALRWKNVYLSS